MTAPRLRGRASPPSPTDRRPPRRGGGSSPSPYGCASAADRATGRALAAALALAFLLTGGEARAQDPPTIDLVSNSGQSRISAGHPIGTNDIETGLAQRFTTGPSAAGYNLDDVRIDIGALVGGSRPGTDLTVHIYTVSSNRPGTLVHTLTSPNFLRFELNEFTAPAAATLEGGTRYMVAFAGASNNSANVKLAITNSDSEDTSSLPGWEIDDAVRQDGSTYGTASLRFKVRGSIINTAPTGLPTIFASGSTLVADIAGIADADGVEDATYEYQWIEVDGTTDTDIAGATDRTYTPTAADAGKTVKVKVAFTDDAGSREELTSATTTVHDSTPVWSTTLTVGESSSSYGYTDGEGTLDDDDFEYGSVTYTVTRLRVATADVVFRVNKTGLPAGDTLTLELGGHEFPFSARIYTSSVVASIWYWNVPSELDDPPTEFPVGTTATACLRTATQACPAGRIDLPAVSTDATLSALSVTGGGSELVTNFASGTLDYSASVDNGVDEVTVTLEKSDSDAMVEYLDSSDAALADAGTAAGHQVALAVGSNVIKVKVTAENGTTTRTYTVTVTRAVGLPTLSIADASATEGSSISFGVTLSAAASENVTVTCTASFETGDTASAADISTTTRTATIIAGFTSGSCEIGTWQENTDAEDETFTVTLSNPSSNAQLGTPVTARGTIKNDDDPPTLSVDDAMGLESNGFLTFLTRISAASGKTVTVDVDTSVETGDTAASGTDFTAYSETLTYNPGDLTVSFTVRVTNDTDVENNETFTVTLSNPSNAGISDATAKGTIEDDDAAPAPTITDVAVTSTPVLATDTYGAGEEILFTVTFSGAVDVTGDPELAFSLDSGEDRAPYKSGTGTDELVFAYTVALGDEDDDGIFLLDGSDFNNRVGPVTLDSDDAIKATGSTTDADLAHTGRGTQSGHKVDGSRTTGNNAPVFTSSASLSVEENTSVATVVAVDNDTDDDITGYAFTGGTDQAFFDNVTTAGQLWFKDPPNFEDPKDSGTDNTYVVTVEATSGTGTREMTATQTITVTVTDADEKSAKPDKPTLAAVTGSSTSLTATWTAPGLNDGPAITGYDVGYKVSTANSWTSFTHTGTGVTATITGLTADTSYQVRVRAKNGETDSDWSDASTAVSTNAAGTTPTITAVAITSTPVLETDTYGQGERIEVTVTFSEAVNATDATTFVLSVGGTDTRAPVLDGSGTTRLVFSYTVRASDEDDNGIWIGDQDRTLVGNRMGLPQAGAITSVATSTAADLSHSGLGTDADHKVDGSRSIVLVAVSSTPMLETDTYGAGETIRFKVTFSSGVSIGGSPVFRFSLGNLGIGRPVDAAYESGAGSAALVFGYTVVSSDEDDDGIWIGHQGQTLVGTHQTGTITIVATSEAAAGIEHDALGVLSGHKVDGSRTPGNNAPVFTSSASLSVEENTTDATVAAVDNDTDDDITDYEITGGTDEGFFSDVTSAGLLTFDEAPNFEDPKDSGTDNTYVVTVEATSGTGTREMTATQTITVTVTDADEKSAKPDKPTLAKVTGSSTTLTATWTKPGLNGGPEITGYDVQYKVSTDSSWTAFAHTGSGLTTTITGLTADTSYQVRVRAKNGETDSDWSDASTAVSTNAAMTPATCTLNTGDVWCGVVTVGTFTLSGTSYLGYLDGTGGGGMLSDNDFDFTDTELDSKSHTITGVLLASGTLSLIFEDSQDEDDKPVLDTWDLQVGTDTFALDDDDVTQLPTGGYQWTGTGLSWSAGDTVTLRLRGETGPPSVANVAVTSVPLLTSSGGSEPDTYGADDKIEFTVTFSRAVVVTGDPQFGFSLSGARQADYDSGGGGTALKFVYTVQSSDSDDDGIWIGNQASTTKSLQLGSNDEITSAGGIDANLEHDQLGARAGHKVDGSRSSLPTLSIRDDSRTEGELFVFVLLLSDTASEDVPVTCTASFETGDTAVAGDLTFTSADGRIQSGQNRGSCSFRSVQDGTDEEDETFTVTLSSTSSNAQLASDPTAKGTINDDDDPPTLSVADVAGAEGEDLVFTVALSAASGKTVTVAVATSVETGDTATSGTDFTAVASTTLTFDAGQEDKTVTVQTTEDATEEENETFTVTLSGPTNATLSTTDATAKGTIIDDDATVPTLSVADAAASEGNDLSFVVTLSAAAAADVTATWTASIETGDTAVAADLGSTKTGTVTVAIGDTDATITVATAEDTTVEVNETFTVTLTGPSSNAALGDATAVGTINNDDLATVNITSGTPGDEDEGVEFVVFLPPGVNAPQDITVTWTASIGSGDSATAADLATTKTGEVTIEQGTTIATFTVPVNDDTTDEPDQTFTVTLSNPTPTSLAQLAADPTATGTIEDDDDRPTLTVADARHVEDNSDSRARVTVSLSEVSEKRVRFKLRPVDRTGDTASDADWNELYSSPPFNTISAGTMSTERFGGVTIVKDTLDEDDETLTVEAYSLENAQGSSSDREATITIEDDDPTPTVTVADAAATEGDKVEFVVTLSAVSGRDVDVDYATSVATGDGAVSGTDFTAASGTLTIAAADNTATGTIEVQTTEDDASESAETFTLTISSPDNATLTTDTTATGTINNRATTADEPTGFEADVGNAQVVLSWDAPDSASGVTRHEYQYKEGTGAYQGWVRIANSGVDGANEAGFTVTGLTNEVLHTFQLRAVNAQGESTAADADPVTPTPGICGRTQQVHENIVYYLEDLYSVERTCAEVNVADLERFTQSLDMPSENIGSLKSGDFAGLTNLVTLNLAANTFTTLPADVFSGLTSLTDLVLNSGALSSIDARAFSGLTTLTALKLELNDLIALPGTVFSGLTALKTIDLQENDLTMLPANVFSGLSALVGLTLNSNDLGSLPPGLFSGLSALSTLQLYDNDLTALPAGLFSGLSALTKLQLHNNDLSSLPDGLLSGLTALSTLKLGDNPNSGDTLALTVTVEKFGTDRARAKVLAGAPAALSFNVTVVNGSLPTGVTKLAVAAGSVDGTAEKVTRTSGTMAAVTVDIDLTTQPTLPTNHSGYEFEKAASGLPAEILPDTRGPQNFTAKPGDGQAVLSWTAPASGSGVTKHQYRQKEGTGSYGSWIDIPNSAEGGANEDGYTVTGLTNETVYTFELKRFVGTTESATAESNAVTPTPGICDRTQQVQDGILAAVSGVTECEAVTVANLAGITFLGLTNKGITSLKAGDFAGLTALESLLLARNSLDELPPRVFDGLTELAQVSLNGNDLTTLPAGVFSGLSKLVGINLSDNALATLPAGLFSGLTALQEIVLTGNNLTALPAGLFSGLTALEDLYLGDNPDTGDTLPLTVTVEKVGTDQVRAKVLAGAPFNVNIPVTPENGTLAGGVTALNVAKGAVEGTAVTVTRTEGTTAAVTVDVDLSTQPMLPSDHEGYEFARAPSGLPAEILPEEASLEPPTGLSATPGDREAVLAWTPPASDSGFTRHQYRYRTDGSWERWTDIPDSGPGGANATRYTVTDLANAVEHTFELRARDAGAGKSDPATVTVEPTGPPRILSVEVVSGPGLDNGTTYGAGEEIRIAVTFDQPVEVEGDPELALDVGGERLAEYHSGEGTETLVFVYVVTASDDDDDGVSVGDDALRLDGDDVIRNGAGDGAELAHDGPGAQPGHRVDGGRRAGVHAHAAFTHSHAHSREQYPEHTHEGHEHPDKANDHQRRPGTHVHHAQEDPNASISGGPDVRTHDGVEHIHRCFDLKPSCNQGDDYSGRGDELGLPIEVTHSHEDSEPGHGFGWRAWFEEGGSGATVTVADAEAARGEDATLDFEVTLDPAQAFAVRVDYATADGTATAGEDYRETAGVLEIPPGQTRATVPVRIPADGAGDGPELFELRLGSATAATVADAEATGTIRTPAPSTPPSIKKIGVASTPRLSSRGTTNRDTYGEGETIRIEVRFDQPVVVDGEPTFALEVGDPCLAACEADYESGSGTNTLVFAYLVLEVDIDRNGIAIRGNPIEVTSGDSIRNAADQDARLSSKGKGTQRNHKADGSRAAASHLSVEDAEAREADGEMEFTVRLEPHGLGIVTVDYATADGTGSKAARAGEDYTETSGALTFDPLETQRTVTVPIIDDAEPDDGETFTLTLSNPDGATLRSGDGEATGTIRNSEPQEALTASFEDMPAAHDGAAFTFRVAFSRDIGISYKALREDAFAVSGGRVTGGKRVDDRRDLFEMTVEPDGGGDVAITLEADRDCAASGAICTKGEPRRRLTNSPSATVAGPDGAADEAEPLTARFEDMPAEHRGEGGFRFRAAFSEDIGISYKALREDAFAVTGGRVTGGKRVDDRRDLFEMTVRPDGGGDVEIELPAGRDCAESGAICTKGELRRRLTNSLSATVAGPGEAPANTPAEGAPAIAGTARVGEALTASTAGVSDADGLENAVFRYQWIRGGADISGATGSSYTAADADEGERLKVRVAFEDDAGNEESPTSAATDAVEAAPRANAPAEGAPAIRGKARVGGTLTASTSGVSDADGLGNAEFAYQWLRGGADIPGATGATYTVVDADEGERLKVRVEFTDDAGNEESVTSAATKAVAARPRPKVSVADARVREAAGATLDFAVTLSIPAPSPVTVGYRTMDASAKAGEDYEARAGKLRFGAGETAKTLRVTVLDDAVDEGDEKMVVVLEPGAGVDRGDRLASGTIENSDPLPAAWLVRFGRTASDHAVEAIEARFHDPGGASHATFGGRRLWAAAACSTRCRDAAACRAIRSPAARSAAACSARRTARPGTDPAAPRPSTGARPSAEAPVPMARAGRSARAPGRASERTRKPIAARTPECTPERPPERMAQCAPECTAA